MTPKPPRAVLAVRELRAAAVAWALARHVPPKDATDRDFARIDQRLRRAAVRYAKSLREIS